MRKIDWRAMFTRVVHPAKEARSRRGCDTQKNGEMGMAEIFHRIWPSAALAVGLGVTAGWIGLWAFALFKLGELAF
jgi:hypothetical protein